MSMCHRNAVEWSNIRRVDFDNRRDSSNGLLWGCCCAHVPRVDPGSTSVSEICHPALNWPENERNSLTKKNTREMNEGHASDEFDFQGTRRQVILGGRTNRNVSGRCHRSSLIHRSSSGSTRVPSMLIRLEEQNPRQNHVYETDMSNVWASDQIHTSVRCLKTRQTIDRSMFFHDENHLLVIRQTVSDWIWFNVNTSTIDACGGRRCAMFTSMMGHVIEFRVMSKTVSKPVM